MRMPWILSSHPSAPDEYSPLCNIFLFDGACSAMAHAPREKQNDDVFRVHSHATKAHLICLAGLGW